MKRIPVLFTVVFIISVVFLFAACSNSEKTDETTSETQAETVVETTVEPSNALTLDSSSTTETAAFDTGEETVAETMAELTNTSTPTPTPMPDNIDKTLEEVTNVVYQAFLNAGLEDAGSEIYYTHTNEIAESNRELGYVGGSIILGYSYNSSGISYSNISIIINELEVGSEAYNELYSNEPVRAYQYDMNSRDYFEYTLQVDAYNGQYVLTIYCFESVGNSSNLTEWPDGVQSICDSFLAIE